jgi:hypothetical protein
MFLWKKTLSIISDKCQFVTASGNQWEINASIEHYICTKLACMGVQQSWGQFLTSPIGRNVSPGVTFDLQGWSYPQGVKTLCSPLCFSKEKSEFTPGDEWSSPVGNIHPWGQTILLKTSHSKLVIWRMSKSIKIGPCLNQLHTYVHVPRRCLAN